MSVGCAGRLPGARPRRRHVGVWLRGWGAPEPCVSPGLPCCFGPALLLPVPSLAAAGLGLHGPGGGPASLRERGFGERPDPPAVSAARGCHPPGRDGGHSPSPSLHCPQPGQRLHSYTTAPGLRAEGFLGFRFSFSWCVFFFFIIVL